MLCVPAAQSNSSPDWEKKVVEYFKEKLKPNDAHTWVNLAIKILFYDILSILTHELCAILAEINETVFLCLG